MNIWHLMNIRFLLVLPSLSMFNADVLVLLINLIFNLPYKTLTTSHKVLAYSLSILVLSHEFHISYSKIEYSQTILETHITTV